MTPPADDDALVRLVERVRELSGVDLAGYGRDGLLRRARHRAALVGADSLGSYLAQVDADEANALLEHVLVQVSGWFRDPWVWRSLLEDVLPGMAARRGGPVDLSVWVAGCGRGQEVWTVAACLARAVGAGHVGSWDLLATDVDPQVLAAVTDASYPVAELPELGKDLLRPHLLDVGGRWQVAPTLGAHVRTAVHDVRDAPPEELGGPADLVVCRNVIMYLDASVRAGVMDGLLASVRPGGVVVLGHAEVPLDRREVLVPVDLRARAYRSIAAAVPRRDPARS